MTSPRPNLPIALSLLIVASIIQFPASGSTPITSPPEESRFIPLSPPPAYSYMEGTVRKFTENGRRYIIFVGTTLIPPYFKKDAEYVFKPIWSPDPKLSTGRWVWDYKIDCDEQMFDRDNDQVGWRSVRWDPTAMAASDLFCPPSKWESLQSR
jgi:hypothetical protein